MAGAKGYKRLLLKVKDLMRDVRRNAHGIATNLVRVFDDRDFRADIGALDDYQAAAVLDREIGCLNVSFLELRAILAAFPNAADWENTSLRELYAKVAEQAHAPSEEDVAKRPRRTVTLKEYERLEQEKRDADARSRHVESRLEVLERENSELREENARLRGRIEELERFAKRDMVAA